SGSKGSQKQDLPLARFRFDGDAKNEGNGHTDFQLRDPQPTFTDKALYLDGSYRFHQRIETPDFEYSAFTVVIRFKAEAFDLHNNIITGGTSGRWFGLHRSQTGNLTITLNGGEIYHATTNPPLRHHP